MDKIINHDVLKQPKKKAKRNSDQQGILLYNHAGELYTELETMGIIDRLKDLHQLGPIRIQKKMIKTRYDYMMLQLYLHQMTKGLGKKLPYSYGSKINRKDFPQISEEGFKEIQFTMADAVQLFTITYNLGHFKNIFSSSRAILMLASKSPSFADCLVESSTDKRFRRICKKMIQEHNYKKLHLLNSILVLERCNANIPSVLIAMELVYFFLEPETIPDSSKLKQAYHFFQCVRDVSYIAYDMQIATTPFRVDLSDESGLTRLFTELLEEYNDNSSAQMLINALDRMLDNSLYNKKEDAIAHYRASRTIVNKFRSRSFDDTFRYYDNFWRDLDSVFNKEYPLKKDFQIGEILKITFRSDEKQVGMYLFFNLERMNNVRVGYYERREGEWTILVALSKKCKNAPWVALQVLRQLVSHLRKLKLSESDPRFLLATKFFLFYLFGQHKIRIDPTIHPSTCLFCTMGNQRRVDRLSELIIHPEK